MIAKKRILIIDDHKMVREGIQSMLLSQDQKYKFIIEEAATGELGVEKAQKHSFDIIIMDYQLPKINGVDATRLILEKKPKSKILALSSYDEYMYIDSIMKAGAKGFVLKNIGPEELINAIESILSGKNYYSNDVANKLISFANTNKFKAQNLDSLSTRELQILKLIAAEYTNEEVATTLHISKRTVDTHRQNLLNKLNVKNTAGLVKYALTYFENNPNISAIVKI